MIKAILAPLILLILCLAAYSNALNGGFMIDDYYLLLGNSQHQVLNNPQDIFLKPLVTGTHYRPLYLIARGLLFQWLGLSPWAYHAFNLLLFFVFVYLGYLLLFKAAGRRRVALTAAMLFAVHPINAVAVNYVTAHAITLFGICFLASIICLLNWADGTPRKRGWYVASLLTFIAGVLFQEIVLILPLFVIATLRIVRGLEMKKVWQASGPFLALAAGYCIFRGYFFAQTGTLDLVSSTGKAGIVPYFISIVELIRWYAEKLVLPDGIVLMRGVDPAAVGSNWMIWTALAIGAGVLGCLWKFRKEAGGWALTWFVLGFLPMIGAGKIFPAMGIVIEPHWFLVSSWGFFYLAAAGLWSILGRWNPKVGWLVMVMLVVSLGAQTRQYNRFWSQEETYCRYWLTVQPRAQIPNFWLGIGALKNGDFAQAERFLERSVSGTFIDGQVYCALGLAKYYQHKDTEAIASFEKAISIDPQSSLLHNNFGAVWQELGNAPKAEEHFFQAIKFNPSDTAGRLNLAKLKLSQGKLSDAVELLEENLKIEPADESTLLALLQTYFSIEDKKKAFALGTEVLNSTKSAQLLVNFGSSFAEHQFPRAAEKMFKRALDLDPLNKGLFMEYGKMRGNNGDLRGAIELWQAGEKLYPDDTKFPELISQARQLLDSGKN